MTCFVSDPHESRQWHFGRLWSNGIAGGGCNGLRGDSGCQDGGWALWGLMRQRDKAAVICDGRMLQCVVGARVHVAATNREETRGACGLEGPLCKEG